MKLTVITLVVPALGQITSGPERVLHGQAHYGLPIENHLLVPTRGKTNAAASSMGRPPESPHRGPKGQPTVHLHLPTLSPHGCVCRVSTVKLLTKLASLADNFSYVCIGKLLFANIRRKLVLCNDAHLGKSGKLPKEHSTLLFSKVSLSCCVQ